jgi:two-component system sensor histidine kinase KdpD
MALREIHSNPEQKKKSLKGAFKWRGYLIGLGLVSLSTVLGHLVRTFFAPTNIIMIYLLCVTVSAVLTGLGPSIMVSILSVLAFDFFFVNPFLTFAVDDTQYIFTFIALLLVGMTISYLTSRVRQQTDAAKLRERETAALYALGRDLAVSGDLASYIKAIVKRIKETLGHDVIIFLPDAQSDGRLKAYAGDGTACSRRRP